MITSGVGQHGGIRSGIGALLLVLLLVGVVFWSVLLPRVETSVFGRVPILDEIYYLDRAAELSGGELCPPDPCFMSPLYPQLIRIAGSDGPVPENRVPAPASLQGIRLLQVLCWLGTVLLLGWIGWRDLAPLSAGKVRRLLVAATPPLLFFLYRPAVVYTTTILVEMPLTFLVTAAVALLPGRKPAGGWRLWRLPAVGLVLGLAGLLRGTALALVPLALWLVIRQERISGRRGWLGAVALVGVVALVLAVPVIHNSRLVGHLSPPTLNGGVNLFIGNGPEANGFYVAAIPGDWRRDPAGRQHLASQLGWSGMSLAQADSVWTTRVAHTMGEDPLRVVTLWGRKFWLHLQGWEIDQLVPLDAWSRQVPAARVLIVPYGLLVMLGLGYGLFTLVRCRRSPAAGWMLGILLIIALQSVFFVVSRYRLVLVPLWALLAAAAIFDVDLSWRKRGLLFLAGLLVVVPWGLRDVRTLWSAMAEANEARRWSQVGVADQHPADLLHARNLYRRALAGGAPGPVPWHGLIAVDSALADEQAHSEDLAQALAAFPEDLELLKQQVSDLLQTGSENQALPLARRILAGHPHDADTLHNAAVLLASLGNTEAALRMAATLVQVHPEDPRGFVDLGIIQARAGMRSAARKTFERGLKIHPDNKFLVLNLERLEVGESP